MSDDETRGEHAWRWVGGDGREITGVIHWARLAGPHAVGPWKNQDEER